ncbi:hypothetical protein LINPERPRIM_LOCUS11870 [Linum perenne]
MEQTLDSITDYTKTQRVVLLLDLNPLLQFPSSSSSSYISSLLSAIKPLITFPQLSSSLFSFKLFFSSLSPLLSSSKLPFPSPSSLSFDLPASTFQSLSQILLHPSFVSSICSNGASAKSSHLAASMRQLVHDYAWESVVNSTSIDGNCEFSSRVRSNLVALFSPVVTELNGLSEFLGVGVDDGCLRDVKEFSGKFRGLFESVNDAFVSRDIHLGWIDVKCDELCSELSGVGSGFFESGIRDLGWGFCSSDTVVLGSAVVPFALIYPRIGMSLDSATTDLRSSKTVLARLSLEIVDVNGNPLECKCCDLELAGARSLFMDSELARCAGKRSIYDVFSNGNSKLHVKAVQMSDDDAKFSRYLPDPIVVRERVEKERNGSRGKELFEEKILQMLEPEMFESLPKKSGPIWQILLSFLCREGYWGLVTLSDGNGCSVTGIFKPFTVSSALLWIRSDEFKANNGRPSVQVVAKMESGKAKGKLDSEVSHIGSSSGPLPSGKASEIRGGSEERKKKKKRKSLSMLQELTWSDFCKAAIEHLETDLEDIYFVRACNKSKKLKFLKCWMKEVKKSTYHSVAITDNNKLDCDVSKSDDRLNELPSQPIVSSASAGEDALTGASRVQDEVDVDYHHSQNLETFLDDLPQKIQQGLECDDVDIGSLAERLVNSSVYWLYKKCENGTNVEDQAEEVKSEDGSASTVSKELMTLLLREPKDLAATKASNPGSTEVASERTVREYELQILFRMEILQSEIGASIKESLKQKFVKQICSCLESIQCRLEGGFFGDWSLDKYVEKILKNRYCNSLDDVVHRIYERLDLLLFEDDDESSNPFLSSEDGNQSLKERLEKTTDEGKCNAEQSSSSWAVESESQGSQDDDNHARRLIEAQERRQRARRFASFTSWVPDLHKVWAPKQQPKSMKVKYDHHLRRHSKLKERKRGSYDVVCETPPMAGKDRSSSSNEKRNRRGSAATTPVCGSVSKALFQDN